MGAGFVVEPEFRPSNHNSPLAVFSLSLRVQVVTKFYRIHMAPGCLPKCGCGNIHLPSCYTQQERRSSDHDTENPIDNLILTFTY